MTAGPQPPRVLFLAPAVAIHTRRWVEALAGRGLNVSLATQHPEPGWSPRGATVHVLPFTGHAGYFANAPAFARLAHRIRPDLVHAHYASGYGTTAALARSRPTLLSVWGSDVYDFPMQSAVAGHLVRWNLRRADHLASTSHAMSDQVRRLVGPATPVSITPFGVDTDEFRPITGLRDDSFVTIGTVKTLAHKYGIDLLLRAFARLRSGPELDEAIRERLRLVVVGDGPDRSDLVSLAEDLGIGRRAAFVGAVPHGEVPAWLNRLDLYVAPSRLDSESFGVAVVEASSCGVPVVVADVGGLSEVVRDGRTGLVVRREDPVALASALVRLVADADLRRRFGEAGRLFVKATYEWSRCVDRMIDVYGEVLRERGVG